MYAYNAVAYLGFHFGGGSKYFRKSGGMHRVANHAFARGVRGMLPRESFLKWCFLENILLKFCRKIIVKIFYIKK